MLFINGHLVANFDPVMIPLWGPLALRYYGLAYLLSFVLGWWMLRLYWRKGKSPLNPEAVSNAMTALVAGVLVGGRLGYFLLYDLGGVLSDPLLIFRTWEGGMASHGGFVGVFLAIVWIGWQNKTSILRIGDLLCSIVPLGLLLGRIANFINGELWGRVSDVAWAVIFPMSAPLGTPLTAIAPRHPSQLYQAALEGLFLFCWMQWRLWRTSALDRPGRLSGEFLLLYAILRAIGELFREPDAALILGLSRGTFYSVFVALAGIGLIVRDGMRQRTEP